jgi:hypothetical protein
MEAVKEPWNSSDMKAKELTLDMFGVPEKVKEMARPIRNAQSYDEARRILNEFVDIPFTSSSHLTASISKNSIKKILSGPAVAESMNLKAHLLAAANLDRLFLSAIEPWIFEMNPTKINDNLKAIHRLYAPLLFQGVIIPVKFTVKEFTSAADKTRIYTIEAIDAEINEGM